MDDKSQNQKMPEYSLKTIQVLLVNHGIPLWPKIAGLESEGFHCYAYPWQSINVNFLIQDHISYFISTKKEIKNRRVCFLLTVNEKPMALVMQCVGFNAMLAQQLDRYLSENSISVHDLLNMPTIREHFKKLYTHVHFLFLGSAANQILIQTLTPAFQNACSGRIKLDFKAIEGVNPSVILLNDCLTMLTKGKTEEISSIEAFCQHRERVAKMLIFAIESIKDRKLQKDILISFLKIAKYLQLQQIRNDHLLRAKHSSQILLEDLQHKYFIYTNTQLSLQKFLLSLEMKTLVPMLIHREKPDSLLDQLKKAQKFHLKELKKWEEDRQRDIFLHGQNWYVYLKNRGFNVINFLYQQSFIYLGIELFPWMGCELAGYFPERTRCYLTSPIASRAYQMLGVCVGGFFTYTAGFYHIARTYVMITSAIEMMSWFQKRCLDDENAYVTPWADYILSVTSYFRIFSMGFSMLESAYLWDVQPMIRAIGGIGGSLALILIIQKLSSTVNRLLTQGSKEERLLVLLILSSIGHDLGYMLTNYGYLFAVLPMLTQHQMRERIVHWLHSLEGRGEFSYLSYQYPSLLTTLKDGLYGNNKIQLEWGGHRNTFFRANCQIVPTEKVFVNPFESLRCNIQKILPQLPISEVDHQSSNMVLGSMAYRSDTIHHDVSIPETNFLNAFSEVTLPTDISEAASETSHSFENIVGGLGVIGTLGILGFFSYRQYSRSKNAESNAQSSWGCQLF